MDCAFCKIISGEEEASRIYEDDKILAFMNLRPINTGAFIVIPKEHIEHFIDIPDDLAAHILLTAQRFARIAQEKFKPKRMGYVVHGFVVSHAHLNVIPINHSDDIVSGKFAKIENGNITFDHTQIPIAPREELDRMAQIIKGNKSDSHT